MRGARVNTPPTQPVGPNRIVSGWCIALTILGLAGAAVPAAGARPATQPTDPFAKALSVAGRCVQQLEHRRRSVEADRADVPAILARACEALDEGEARLREALAQAVAAEQQEDAPRPPKQPSQSHRLRIQLCRLALLRVQVYRLAGAAAPVSDARHAAWLKKAVDLCGDVRVEYMHLPLQWTAYVLEAQAHLIAGDVKEAHASLDVVLKGFAKPTKPWQRALVHTALLQKLRIDGVADPAKALREGALWRGSSRLRTEPLWRARIDWALAQACVARMETLAPQDPRPVAFDDLLGQASRRLRDPHVVQAMSRPWYFSYDRLTTLARLDEWAGGSLLTVQECLHLADLLARTGHAAKGLTMYRRGEKAEGRPLSVQRRLILAGLQFQEKQYLASAETCDRLLAGLGPEAAERPRTLRLRASALVRACAASDGGGNARLTDRTLAGLLAVVNSSLPIDTRRDALRQYAALELRRSGPEGCLAALKPHQDLVEPDAYLLYVQASGHWRRLTAAPPAGATAFRAKAQQVLAKLGMAQKTADVARESAVAAHCVLLRAQILAGPPTHDLRAALKLLDDEWLKLTPVKDMLQLAWVQRVRWLTQMGLVDRAVESFMQLKRDQSQYPAAVAASLVETLAERHKTASPGAKAGLEQQIIKLANEAMSKAMADPAEYSRIARRIARALVTVKAYSDAENILNALLLSLPAESDTPGRLEASLTLVDVLHLSGKLNEAKEELERLAKRHPANVAVQLTRGNLALALSMPKEAMTCFRRARELQPKGSVGWCRATLALARGHVARGQKQAARNLLRFASEVYPRFGNPELRAELKRLRSQVRSTPPG